MTESVRNRPRTLHVIYSNPECHQTLLDHGFTEQPVRYNALEKLLNQYLSVLNRYRYDP